MLGTVLLKLGRVAEAASVVETTLPHVTHLQQAQAVPGSVLPLLCSLASAREKMGDKKGCVHLHRAPHPSWLLLVIMSGSLCVCSSVCVPLCVLQGMGCLPTGRVYLPSLARVVE